MAVFEFSIIASGLDPQDPNFETQFLEVGCDDATISYQRGHIIVDFSREANSIEVAMDTAVRDVLSVGAKVERVEPDPLVSLSDIADRSGKTRQAISLFAQGTRRAGFPAPIARVTSSSPLWDWAEVAEWFHQNGHLSGEVVKAARALTAINASLDAR